MVRSSRPTLRTGAEAIWSLSATRATTNAIEAHSPDVVHVHNLYPALSPAVVRAARSAGVPVVMTLHNFRLACLSATLLREGKICEVCVGHLPWQGVRYGCYRGSRASSAAIFASVALHRGVRTFDEVARFAVVSAFILSRVARAGVDVRRAVVRPNFSWPAERRVGPGDYFLYLGRLSEEKGAAPLVSNWSSPARLVVAGDGPERPSVEQAARGRNVELLGAVERERAQELVRGARAVVVPSLCYEGAPRVIVEAYAAGVPVIATRIGGIPEQVQHERSGLLVDPGEPDGWRRAADALEDDATSEELGEAAYSDWHERFSPEVGLASLEAIYADAIGRSQERATA